MLALRAVPRRRAPLTARDWILLTGFLAVWLVCWILSARSIVRGSRYLPLMTAPVGSDAYPVVTGFLPWLPGEASGIRVGDRLLRIRDRDLRGIGPVDLVALVVELAGRAERVSVVFEHAGEQHETALPLGSMAILWPSLPTSLVFVVTGVLLLVRARPPTQAVRATAVSLLTAALYLGVNFIEPGVIYPNIVVRAVAGSLFGPLAMRAMFAFMGDPTREGRLIRFGPWVLAFSGPLEVVGRLTGWPHLETALLVSGAIVAGVLLVTGTYLYRRAGAVIQRQARWAFYGLYCGLAPALVLFVATMIDPTLVPLAIGVRLTAVLVPVCIVIAIVRYDLFDVDRLISATASYNVVLVLVLAGGLLVAPRVAGAASSTFGVDPSLGQMAVALLLAGVVVPAHRRLRPQIERVFFPERYAIDRGIEQLLRDLSDTRSVEPLLERSGEGLDRLIRPEWCVVFARVGETYAPVFVRATAMPSALDADGPLVATVRLQRGTLAVGARAADRRDQVDPFGRAALEALDAAVILPIRRGDELVGFVCLGPKRSGDIYTPTDLRLLATVADKLSSELARIAQDEVLRESARLRDALRRYVPGAVAEELASGRALEAGERDVSILFVDLRSYTTYAETRRATETFSTVSRYTEAVSGAVRDHGGSVVEFAGDGLMAVFGAPAPLSEKEQAAVAASWGICRAVAALGEGTAAGDARLAVGIGVATGLAFVGDVQAVDRAIWTAIGDSVNLAARLQALSRDLAAAIVIDARTWSALDPDTRSRFRCREAVSIRGRRQVEDVYIVPLTDRT
jgi:class 3 adenylate cyclase